ncbi:flagellar motor switch protein FliN [Bryobacter aggregatus]|uniref:flagellar motor switch protein FliN n=1 Tax=Bryobacter aggregatus TaxID=360054 RepID=UPI0006894091|nr:flagellar motor switch protein FliN [Bryobacter aggregatus]
MKTSFSRDELVSKLKDNLSIRIAQSLEAMIGATQRCHLIPEPPSATAGQEGKDFHGWTATYTAGARIQFRVFATAENWRLIGKTVLEAAGLDEFDDATLLSTYTETLAQAASSFAQDLSSLAGQKWEVSESHNGAEAEGNATAWGYAFPMGEAEAQIAVQVSEDLLALLLRPAASLEIPPQSEMHATPSQFDLLLDVELPVSVSFGRALVPLKEILKLNSGSIVELNRAVTEPVEVIVNNCVIARGEVVVVEGNYGVRIQQIISRQDRLRTVN